MVVVLALVAVGAGSLTGCSVESFPHRHVGWRTERYPLDGVPAEVLVTFEGMYVSRAAWSNVTITLDDHRCRFEAPHGPVQFQVAGTGDWYPVPVVEESPTMLAFSYEVPTNRYSWRVDPDRPFLVRCGGRSAVAPTELHAGTGPVVSTNAMAEVALAWAIVLLPLALGLLAVVADPRRFDSPARRRPRSL